VSGMFTDTLPDTSRESVRATSLWGGGRFTDTWAHENTFFPIVRAHDVSASTYQVSEVSAAHYGAAQGGTKCP